MAAVLITGAGGLIGRTVVAEAGAAGLATVPLGREDGDLLAPDAWGPHLDAVLPSAVLHLAWSAGGRADYRASADNLSWVESTLTLVDECLVRGIDLYVTGSVVDAQPDGVDAYTRAKQLLRSRLEPKLARGMMTLFRPTYVFAPDDGRPAVVRDAQSAQARGARVMLRSPLRRHDFVHVDDVGSAMVTAVKARSRGIIDIGSGRLHTVAELVEALGAQWLDAEQEPANVTHLEEVAELTVLTDLGWSPQRTREVFSD